MRPFLLGLALAALLAACGISQSTTAPLQPAPTPGPSEAPTRVVDVAGTNGESPMRMRLYDRSLAVTSIRSATADELRGLGPLDWNAVGAAGSDGRQVLVTWAAREGDETGALFVGPGADEIVVVPSSHVVGGANREVRGVVVEFKLAVDLDAVRFDLRPAAA